MANLTIYPHLSPRVIEVASPTTNISVQELVDLVRAWEDTVRGLNFPFLIDAAGKEDLGGGVFVGISATLQNAVIAFEIQGGVDSSGTVTTLDTTGTVLIDSTATFISDGIVAGDTVVNVTDASITSVLRVDSETQLTTFVLQSGADNQFDVSDSYKVWNKVQCEVAGGNLVAVDESGAVMSPFLPTAQTHVLRSSSSSATLQELSAIQFSSFDGGVTIDTTSGVAGTTYPIGALQVPVNNLADAQTIAVSRGFTKLYIKGDLTIGATDDISDYEIIGSGASFTAAKTTIVLTAGCTTSNTTYRHLAISGQQNGESNYYECIINELTNTHCLYSDCGLLGPLTKNNAAWTVNHSSDYVNCRSNSHWFVLDCNDSPISQVFTNLSGKIKVINHTNASAHTSIKLSAGEVWIDSSCTAGMIVVSGVGTLIDDSTQDDLVDSVALVNNVPTTYNGTVYIDANTGSAGDDFPIGTFSNPVNNIADAMILINKYNLNHLHFHSNMTIPSGVDLSYRVIEGHSSYEDAITFESGALAINSVFRNIKVMGISPAVATYEHCFIDSLTNMHGNFMNCIFDGSNSVADGIGAHMHMISCRSHSQTPVVIDVGDATVNCSEWVGMLQIAGKDDAATEVNVGMTWGYLILDDTNTAGTIYAVGKGLVQDNSAGTTVNVDNVETKSWVAQAVWDEATTGHQVAGSSGKALTDAGAAGNPWGSPVEGNTAAGTFGELVGKKLLTIAKFLGLK